MKCIQLEWTCFDSYWHHAFFLHGNMAAGIHTCLSLAWVGVFRGQLVKSYRKGEVVLSRLRIGHTYFPTRIFYVGKILLNAQHVRRSTLSDKF